MIVSITRLHLRSSRFLPALVWYSLRSAAQAARSPGFAGGKLFADRGWAFWTMTAWKDEPAMRAFRDSGIHLSVMPKLAYWCDGALTAHWNIDEGGLPSWPEAHLICAKIGRMVPVRAPSPTQQTRQPPTPRNPSFFTEFPIRRIN